MYSKRKLCTSNELQSIVGDLSYSCGATMDDVNLPDYLKCMEIRSLCCSDPIKRLYYSACPENVLCIHCGDTENLVSKLVDGAFPYCKDCESQSIIFKRKSNKQQLLMCLKVRMCTSLLLCIYSYSLLVCVYLLIFSCVYPLWTLLYVYFYNHVLCAIQCFHVHVMHLAQFSPLVVFLFLATATFPVSALHFILVLFLFPVTAMFPVSACSHEN